MSRMICEIMVTLSGYYNPGKSSSSSLCRSHCHTASIVGYRKDSLATWTQLPLADCSFLPLASISVQACLHLFSRVFAWCFPFLVVILHLLSPFAEVSICGLRPQSLELLLSNTCKQEKPLLQERPFSSVSSPSKIPTQISSDVFSENILFF